MKKFLRNNSLAIALFILFAICIIMQAITGLHEHNEDLQRHHMAALSMGEYLLSGHFIEATFENWESEFFQMCLYVLFTAFLYQKGSSESNLNEDEKKHPLQIQIDQLKEQLKQEQIKKHGLPWAVRKGGVWKVIYSHSFSAALFLLFVISWLLHALGGWKQNFLEQQFHNEPPQTLWDFIASSDFWFQSFQNWQSEFLSVAVLVIISIYCREKGSAQSKDVEAPHAMTGD